MQRGWKNRRGVGWLAAALIAFTALPALAQSPAAGTADEWANKLAGLDTEPDLDLAALRQQATDRIKARAKPDAAPLKRPLIAPDLLKLPQFSAELQFDEDAAVIRPSRIGRWGASPIRSTSRRSGHTNS